MSFLTPFSASNMHPTKETCFIAGHRHFIRGRNEPREESLNVIYEIPLKVLVVVLSDIDLDLKLIVVLLLNLHDLWGSHFRWSLHIIQGLVFDHFFEFHLKDRLINEVLPFLCLLSLQHVIQYVQHIDTVCTYLEHLLVGVDLIFGLLSQLHLVLDSFAESRERVLVIVVSLLPEYS